MNLTRKTMKAATAKRLILDYLVRALEENDDYGGGQIKVYFDALPTEDDETTLGDLVRIVSDAEKEIVEIKTEKMQAVSTICNCDQCRQIRNEKE